VVIPPLVPAPHVETPLGSPPPSSPPPPRGLPGQRIAALAVGGVGVVSLGVGTFFGATALAKKNDPGSTAWNDGNISTITLSVGAAAVIGGGLLWLLTPAPKTETAWLPRATVDTRSATFGVSRAW
jgi:serine/threonine-protein kinase